MNEILLCSHNPILIKNLYGILRDEGYSVETADHPSLAVQMALRRSFGAIIVDSEPFGLSGEDAVRIIKTVSPGTRVIVVGYPEREFDALCIGAPVDLEEFKRIIRGMNSLGAITQH